MDGRLVVGYAGEKLVNVSKARVELTLRTSNAYPLDERFRLSYCHLIKRNCLSFEAIKVPGRCISPSETFQNMYEDRLLCTALSFLAIFLSEVLIASVSECYEQSTLIARRPVDYCSQGTWQCDLDCAYKLFKVNRGGQDEEQASDCPVLYIVTLFVHVWLP